MWQACKPAHTNTAVQPATDIALGLLHLGCSSCRLPPALAERLRAVAACTQPVLLFRHEAQGSRCTSLPKGPFSETLPVSTVACMQEDQGDSLKQQLDDTIAKGLAAVPDTLGQALVWEQAFRALQELQMKASLEGLLPKLQLAVLRSAAMTPVRPDPAAMRPELPRFCRPYDPLVTFIKWQM